MLTEIISVNVHEWLNYQNTLNHAANELVEARQRAANMGLTDQVVQLGKALEIIFAVQQEADKPL